MTNLHNVENENVLEKSENKVVLEFVIPASSDFLTGIFRNLSSCLRSRSLRLSRAFAENILELNVIFRI